MASANEVLMNNAVAHQILLQGYSNDVARKVIGILNKLDKKLEAELRIALEDFDSHSFNINRINQLLKSVIELNGNAYSSIGTELEKNLSELVAFELEINHEEFKAILPASVSVTTVTPEVVYAAALSRPFQLSKNGAVPLKDYLSGLEESRASAIRDAVRLGYVSGDTLDKIVRKIIGTKTNNYADGLLEAPRHHVEGMVRTAINHMSNYASNSFYKANESIIKGWKFVATLDSRTSVTCASLDSKVYKIGEGPMPPLHINCRSRSVPVTKSWRELGIDIDEIDQSTRASLDGQVPENLSYSDWLRKKPASFQDEVLGATRGKLFRSNKVEIDSFTNNKSVVYSLDELRKRRKELFEKAGI